MPTYSNLRLKFGLRAVLGLVGVLAMACILARYTHVGAAVYWLVLIGISLGGNRGNAVNKAPFWICLCVVQVVFMAGFACTITAYDTLGFLASAGLWMLMVVHFVPAVLCAAERFRWAIFVALLILSTGSFTIIPEQAELTYRLQCCKRETQQLIRYLENSKQESGVYPPDLTGYNFQYPNAVGHITYTRQAEDYRIYFAISRP